MTTTSTKNRPSMTDETVHYTMEDRERLGRLEGDVINLQAGFGDLRLEVRKGFESLSASIADQARRVEQGGRTNWNVVLTGLGTIITLSIAAASVTVMYVNNTIKPQELAIDYLRLEIERDHNEISEIMGKVPEMIDDEISKFDQVSVERGKTIERRMEANEERINRNESGLMSRSEFVDEMRERVTRLETMADCAVPKKLE